MNVVRLPVLDALAAIALAVGLGLVLAVAAGRVGSARTAAAEAEARMAATLWEGAEGSAPAVTALLGERATIVEVDLGGAGTGAYAYEAGALNPAVWVAVAPHRSGGPRATFPAGAAAIALAGAAIIAGWAASRRHRPTPTPHRYPAGIALLSVGCIALTAVVAGRWADRELRALSTATVAQGARAFELALANGVDTARAARVAQLPWARDAELQAADEQWTMPASVAAAIAASPERIAPMPPGTPAGPSYEVEADGLIYHATHTADTHFALLGYERTASPVLALAAAAAFAALLVALALHLVQLAARPRALRRTLAAWSLLAPAAVLILAFTIGPLLFSLWISLHEWRLIDPGPLFLGLDNYAGLLADGDWWSAIGNTALFTLHVPAAMAIALALALLTRGSRRAMRWARLALFLPGITSVAAIAVVWKWLLSDRYGLLNRGLERVGLESVPWLTSPDTALVSLMAIGVWMVAGYQMVVFQAGLAAIPRDWYDAARVDGAGPWQRFRHVTLPGLRHTLFFVLVTSVIGSFQVFGLVYVMTEGGPLGATDVAVYHIYREAWEFLQFGNAAAMSWMLFAVVFAATWLHFRFLDMRRAHG
ncbi:MAG: sugar ABC transporter permease [Gemmatimonadales bacterium]|nr:sugar ABC transporter permease [Gemmatimonadales bacterium]MYG47816.1 sugar ABC transporter permease [Gemmatimonadales bacterium]MYK00901.1 sugar ABC transporter permease [Candidatus Palauibacter ramosifaciens]